MKSPFNTAMQHILARATPLRVGELRLIVKFFHDDSCASAAPVEHEHPFYEFSFMNQGRCRYFLNEKKFVISSENQKIAFIPSTKLHARCADNINTAANIALAHISIEAVSAAGRVTLRKFRKKLNEARCVFQKIPELEHTMNQLRVIVEGRNSLWAERGENKLKEFFLIFFSTYFPELFAGTGNIQIPAAQRNELTEQIVKTVDEMLNTHANALQHARRIGLSERHISRLLNAEFGMPLGKYIVHKRVEAAKQMLSGNMNSVKDTAGALGFPDTSHFCRIFRLHTGFTPKQYALAASEKSIGRD